MMAEAHPDAATAFLALGSNLGDRLGFLREARGRLLGSPLIGAGEVMSAPVYCTAPVDCPPGSDDFFNTVIAVPFGGDPLALLRLARETEAALGRPAERSRNAPRPIDVDLLAVGEIALDHPELQLPHPRLHQRRFVLQPLAEIAPDLVLPGREESAAELLAALDSAEPPSSLSPAMVNPSDPAPAPRLRLRLRLAPPSRRPSTPRRRRTKPLPSAPAKACGSSPA
ncbi:MAG: 2-amino-4-hydroxy-6-hydroxymethyldihydropteridine diphosphokinase [Verrucomicrobiales bacterium]